MLMKKQCLCLMLAAFLGGSLCVQAQKDDDGASGRRQARVEKMAKQLAKQMDLDDSTADWFIPLYVEYSDTLRAVRTSPLRSREVDEVSDAEALEAVEAMFAASECEAALKRAYYARFKEKLTGQQVLRVFMPASPKRQSDGNRRPGGFGGPGGFPGGFGGPGGF